MNDRPATRQRTDFTARLRRRRRWPWLAAVAVLVILVLLVAWTEMEHRLVRRQFEHTFRSHLEAVSRLIWQGANRAAQSLDLLYQQQERILELAAGMLEMSHWSGPENRQDGWLRQLGLQLWLVRLGDQEFGGDWGPLAGRQARAEFLEQMLAAPEATVVESGPARRWGLYCLRFAGDGSQVILCRKWSELAALRRVAGLGELLGSARKWGLRYAVIQDETGVLAGSPPQEALSGWNDDSLLTRARHEALYRMVGETLYEGLVPFDLPDGTRAVLRVAVDTGPMRITLEKVEERHLLLYSLAFILVAGILTGAWLWQRREHRRLEVEARLAGEVEQRRHWQMISSMAQGVAHEVRNPLNSIGMVAQRLQKEFTVPEEQREEFAEMIGVIRDQVERLDRVVGEFMELGRPLVLQRQNVELPELLHQALTSSQVRAAQEGKKLQLKSEPPAATAALDRLRFSQIFSNLVGNALDAIGPGGTVTVALRVAAEAVELEVTDDGPGLDEAELAKVMQPFFTTKANGSGLGLPLVQRLCRAHGGELLLRSRPGEGTTALARLPVAPGEEDGGRR